MPSIKSRLLPHGVLVLSRRCKLCAQRGSGWWDAPGRTWTRDAFPERRDRRW